MSYYHQNPYAPGPPAPYGIAPPLQPSVLPAAAPLGLGYAAYQAYPQQAAAYQAYAAQQQQHHQQQQQPYAHAPYGPAAAQGYYPAAAQGYYPAAAYPAAGLAPTALGPAFAYGLSPAAAGAAFGYGAAFPHRVVPGAVQLDAYGLPFVPGDVALPYAQTFRVEEQALSATHDSYVVRDAHGAQRYKVDGSFTVHERKVIRDMRGHTLLKLREARLKMRDRITLFSPADVPVLTLQKTSAIQIGTKRVHGFVGAHPKASPDLVISGNHNNTHFRIVSAAGQEIGEIRRRKFSMKNMLTDQDTYDVTVHAGSPALVCFLAVVLDEIYED